MLVTTLPTALQTGMHSKDNALFVAFVIFSIDVILLILPAIILQVVMYRNKAGYVSKNNAISN